MFLFAKVVSIVSIALVSSGALVHGCQSGTRLSVDGDPTYEVRRCQETCMSAPESKACLQAVEDSGEICRQKIKKGYDERYRRMQRQLR